MFFLTLKNNNQMHTISPANELVMPIYSEPGR